MDTWTDKSDDYVVGYWDMRWQLICRRCPKTPNDGNVVTNASTPDYAIKAFANAAARHEREVHGATT